MLQSNKEQEKFIWSGKRPSGMYLVGKMSVRKMSVGEVSVGDVSVGEVSVGEISVGELSGHRLFVFWFGACRTYFILKDKRRCRERM